MNKTNTPPAGHVSQQKKEERGKKNTKKNMRVPGYPDDE
jgi:hypothetical protein